MYIPIFIKDFCMLWAAGGFTQEGLYPVNLEHKAIALKTESCST